MGKVNLQDRDETVRVDSDVEDFRIQLGSRVERELDRQNLRQQDLADMANLSISTVSSIIKGGRMPSAETLRDVADALRVSSDYLLGMRPKNYDDLMRDPRIAHAIRCINRFAVEDQNDVLWFIDCVEKRCASTHKKNVDK